MPTETKTDRPKEILTVRDGIWYKRVNLAGKEFSRVVEKGYYCANGIWYKCFALAD